MDAPRLPALGRFSLRWPNRSFEKIPESHPRERDRRSSAMRLDNVKDVYPLSPMQQGLLFHSLYASTPEVYFQEFTCTIPARINLEAFDRAWQLVIDRHAVLRTAFFWEGLDEPLQVVRHRISFRCERIDWQSFPVA